jgi:hypothetical protein
LSLPELAVVVGGVVVGGVVVGGVVVGGGVVVEPEDCTTMMNAGNTPFEYPSYAVITMFEYVPTLLAVGVPDNRPVVVLKLAQDGLSVMTKSIRRPFGSTAESWKE